MQSYLRFGIAIGMFIFFFTLSSIALARFRIPCKEVEIVKAMINRGAPAVGSLTATLKDNTACVRSWAAEALGEIKDYRAVESLILALKDKDYNVRESAARALGKINDFRATEPLIDALIRDIPRVSDAATEALRAINDPRSVEPLIIGLKDENRIVRSNAARVLGRTKNPRAVEPLITALNDKSDDLLRRSAAYALGETNDRRAVAPLIAALKDVDPLVRRGVVYALGQLKDPRALDHLQIIVSNDKDSNVRSVAQKALQALKSDIALKTFDRRAFDPLKDYSADCSRVIPSRGKENNYNTIEDLIVALKDECGRREEEERTSWQE